MSVQLLIVFLYAFDEVQKPSKARQMTQYISHVHGLAASYNKTTSTKVHRYHAKW